MVLRRCRLLARWGLVGLLGLGLLNACGSDDKAKDVAGTDDVADQVAPDTAGDLGSDVATPDTAGDSVVPDALDVAVPDVLPDLPDDVLTDAGDTTPDTHDTLDTLDQTDTTDVVDITVLPGKVRLIRDKWGTPHIIADTDFGALYGYGYALAEDNLLGLLNAAWTVQGRRSEFEGEAGLGMDRTMRLFRMVADMEAAYPNMPADIQEMLQGFAAGINRFMADHPEKVPAWGNEPFQPWWSPAIAKLIFFTPQLTGANNDVDGWCEQLWEMSFGLDANEHFTIGSNGFAMDPSRTVDGVGLMGGDPHLPWKFEWRFYEVHMRGKTFEVAGASPIGSPVPVIGRTADIAWTWTSNGPDAGDVFLVPLDTANPGHYLLDDQSYAFEPQVESYKMPDGEIRTVTEYRSVHGPIVCFREDQQMAVAMRLTVDGLTGTSAQFLDMIRSKNLNEFNTAMEQLQIGHFSLVAGDNSGNVEYHWGGRIPVRNPNYDYDHPVDGSTSDSLWSQEEMVPFTQLPMVMNPTTGWVQSCNNGPDNTTMTENDPDPATIPLGVTDVGNEEVRSWYLRRQLARENLFTEEDGLALITDGYMIPHNPLNALLVYAWEQYGAAYPGNDLMDEMIAGLAEWNGMPRNHRLEAYRIHYLALLLR